MIDAKSKPRTGAIYQPDNHEEEDSARNDSQEQGMDEQVKIKCKVRLCEVLLRHHSDLKSWYKRLASQVKPEYEEGFFLDFRTFFKLLVDTRMVNGRLNFSSLLR